MAEYTPKRWDWEVSEKSGKIVVTERFEDNVIKVCECASFNSMAEPMGPTRLCLYNAERIVHEHNTWPDLFTACETLIDAQNVGLCEKIPNVMANVRKAVVLARGE